MSDMDHRNPTDIEIITNALRAYRGRLNSKIRYVKLTRGMTGGEFQGLVDDLRRTFERADNLEGHIRNGKIKVMPLGEPTAIEAGDWESQQRIEALIAENRGLHEELKCHLQNVNGQELRRHFMKVKELEAKLKTVEVWRDTMIAAFAKAPR